ncbi:homoaconitate hydratase family protein [Heliobacterium gestii]|uniref:3-isopropylmalate dehydratase large subunit n=1 Tax=Heliomicrobium gestii TaxID=2699 RepID=A0A845LIM7_HELGE|nr:3-isopropylmalate dehydratase large subunit [Heliomicrobium gestii]MBM7865948.1 3-isopropylmalate/(R)-2-methylmalate dehydratase large subunit [Heliomicrobium gestii]MZP42716.1 homoaconitate hydratase family protein [Heliomicrobium gestii]
MGKTMAEKIFQAHNGGKEVKTGEIVFANVDLVMGTDATVPLAIGEFEKIGKAVFDPAKVVLVQDHFVPARDTNTANLSNQMRQFARKHGITHHVEVGRGGICHHYVPDSGLCNPGDLIIGADSHTTTYGAFGALGTGVGSTDFAAAMATGRLWFKVPPAIKVVLTGKKKKYVQGKDIILKLISMIGVDGAAYKSLEFTGPSLKHLDMADRITICNMAVEAGAKAGIFEVDDVTADYFKKYHKKKDILRLKADADAEYVQEIPISISDLEPLVAEPYLPSKVKGVKELQEIAVDQVFIGSCTNGRMEDMRQAAKILSKRRVHPDVRLIVIPGTYAILEEMAEEGIMETFIAAGASVQSPTCGPCCGGHTGILGDDEVCLSTSNRNFVGRMGSPSSRVYLANPAVAAASAVAGKIIHPEDLCNE